MPEKESTRTPDRTVRLSLPRRLADGSTGRQVALIVGLVIVILAVIIGLQVSRPAKVALSPVSHFDPRANVRLLDISRVYKIKPWDRDSAVLWFTTAEGIRVLDRTSSEWTRYGLDHGLPSEIVSDICFMDGVPWVGTWNGVAWLNDSIGGFSLPPSTSPLRDARVLAIEYLPYTGVFVSVDGKGLFRVDHPDSAPVRIELPGVRTTDRITCLRAIGSTLYIGCEGRRLFALSSHTNKIHAPGFERKGSSKTLIWDVIDHRGALWVATSDDGLWRRSASDSLLRPVPGFAAKGAYCFSGEEDGFWCGTPFGLWRHHDREAVWIQFIHPEEKSAVDFQVFSLYSNDQSLWYGSMDLGAGFLTKDNVAWFPMRAGLSNPNVAALAAQDSVFWTGYGYQGGYLDRFETETVQYDRNFGAMDGIVDDHVQSMTYSDSVLYFGTYRGFGYLNPFTGRKRFFETEKHIPFGDIAHIACVPDSGVCYLAGQFGIIVFDRVNETFRVIQSTIQYRITSILPAGDTLWFGTLGSGMAMLSPGSETVTPGPLRNGTIVAVEPWGDDDRRIFVATKEDGWYIIDKEDSRKTVRLKPPASPRIDGPGSAYSGHIMAARRLGSHLWLGTRNEGVIVVGTATGTSIRLTEHDGLVSNQIRSLAESSRYIWIGCYGGLNRIDKVFLKGILPR